ncbi:MAG: hypothetical protein R2718_01300 [Solirubrobacterales bacterium]|nr:hypothetical protein [Solirubrobacterales bacterium]
MAEPSQPLLPPGTGPKLARAALDGLGALIWFALALICGGNSTELFLGGSDVFAFLAVAAALTVGVTFGLRMASIALDRVPAWVPRVEVWAWVALPVWFGLAVAAVRI